MCFNQTKGNWIQCQQCGHIYHIEQSVPVDQLYVKSLCPKCDHDKGLNCGDDEDSIYRYSDPVLDERYY